jgi:hypothetical protein
MFNETSQRRTEGFAGFAKIITFSTVLPKQHPSEGKLKKEDGRQRFDNKK